MHVNDTTPGGETDRNRGGTVPRHALLEQLSTAARVTMVTAPAGSGKTILLRSWIRAAAPTGSVAWVAAGVRGGIRSSSGRRCWTLFGRPDPDPHWYSR